LKAEQEHLRKNIFGKALPGEDKARESKTFTTFPLTAKRNSEFGNLAEYHYRYAESQFLRLAGGQAYHVTKVDYIVNPPLMDQFETKQKEFMSRGVDATPILAFHGTKAENLDSIIRNNFSLTFLSKNSGDNGWFGAGLYFSEYTTTSLGYNQNQSMSGGAKLLLSKVLIGKQYKCPGRMDGKPLQPGHDSHLSPEGHEVVIFDPRQILPCYLVYYAAGAAQVST